MDFSAIIVAAGSGTRAGSGVAKQWRNLGGKPVLRWSVEALLAAGALEIIVVLRPEDFDQAADVLSDLGGWLPAEGGATRALSVVSGLRALGEVAAVLVHDAARPLVNGHHVVRLLTALENADGAIPTLPVADTLKRAGDSLATVSRYDLLRAQTPQAFRMPVLRAAYDALPADAEPTDDAAVVERMGQRVVAVPGDPRLLKLTYAEDFAMAEALITSARIIRTGQGFDAHRFGPGDGVWLCGVKISHDQSLIGHSDADAGLHALTDAILGAIGEGDIGDHFPPTDPRWKGAASDLFLRHAAGLVTKRGGRVLNLDVTLVCEKPKIKPYRLAMRERLAEILGLPLDRVSVKATTTEGMGFTGRGEGLAAQAIATVEMPA